MTAAGKTMYGAYARKNNHNGNMMSNVGFWVRWKTGWKNWKIKTTERRGKRFNQNCLDVSTQRQSVGAGDFPKENAQAGPSCEAAVLATNRRRMDSNLFEKFNWLIVENSINQNFGYLCACDWPGQVKSQSSPWNCGNKVALQVDWTRVWSQLCFDAIQRVYFGSLRMRKNFDKKHLH